jgi:nitrate reductase assembly molybdenum cofactor insertion protein NarJ
MHDTVDRDLCDALAALLDYPHASVDELAWCCQRLAGPVDTDAAQIVERFARFAETTTPDELQEAYTRAFDLDSLSEVEPTWYPYVGHQLVEDHSKRSGFLVELSSRYKAHGFEAGTELPDHIVVMLRFVSVCSDEQLVQELIHEGLIPALGAVAGVADTEPTSGREHYFALLIAARRLLEAQPDSAIEPSEETEPAVEMSGFDDPNDPRRR